MRFNSIKFEISILYTAILGLFLMAFSGVLYFISNAFLQQIDQQLKVKAQAVDLNVRSYLSVLGDSRVSLIQAVEKTMDMKKENIFQYKTWKITENWVKQAQSLNLNRDYIDFINKGTNEVLGSANLDRDLMPIFMEDVRIPKKNRVSFKTLIVNDKVIRVINYPFSDKALGQYLIQVGIAQDPFMQQLRNWLYSIAIVVPLILVLTIFVGRLMTNRILEPVYEITAMANRITRQDLSARIKNKQFGREMETLVGSFNEMIARLEMSFKHIEQFSYHVAHELKTPLTIIGGEAELLLRKERTKQEYQQALKIVMEESRRVLKTIDDLLLITKLGYQPEAFKFEEFDFIEFFGEIVEQNRLVAANKGIGIRMNMGSGNGPWMIKGDRLHLRRLFFNIIDNAIKFTPQGGLVDLRIERAQHHIISTISDTGPGIAPGDLGKIFEEFYRADKNTPGSGLGLNIAYTIARLHQGEIKVESQLGHGAAFRIILPS